MIDGSKLEASLGNPDWILMGYYEGIILISTSDEVIGSTLASVDGIIVCID